MIKIADIASELVSAQKMKRKDAELFIASFVDVINDALRDEGIVKIKGLGTFKMMNVSSRESVDVNTGERITIDGRAKISFTPDAVLRDQVNKPFAHFETVVLNDGVDFSDIDEKYENQLNDDLIAETATRISETMESSIPMESSTAVEEPTEKSEDEELVVTPPEEEPIATLPEEEPVVTLPEEEPVVATAEEEPIVLEGAPEPTDDSAAFLQGETAGQAPSSEEWKKRYLHTSRMFHIMAACFVLLLIIAGVGYFLLFQQLTAQKHRIEHLIALKETTVSKAESDAPKAESDTIKAESRKQKAETEKVESDAPKAESDVPNAESQKQKAEDSKAEDYNKDPRVRYGAYMIEGVAQTITVMPGQTLYGISKAYLGDGMQCYVEAVNGGIQTVKAGQKLNIPKLKLKKRKKSN
jgi:nucleoid DNA-binding protein